MGICMRFHFAGKFRRRLMSAHSLRQKLPFEDDEFDHVHIHGLAFAVPENKVSALSGPLQGEV